MADPVVAADGFSYEREAILQWFRLPGPVRSPMTGGVLASEELTSNQNLKNQIAEWRDATSVRQHPRAFSIFYRGQLQGTQAVWPGMLVETLRQRSAERLRVPLLHFRVVLKTMDPGPKPKTLKAQTLHPLPWNAQESTVTGTPKA